MDTADRAGSAASLAGAASWIRAATGDDAAGGTGSPGAWRAADSGRATHGVTPGRVPGAGGVPGVAPRLGSRGERLN